MRSIRRLVAISLQLTVFVLALGVPVFADTPSPAAKARPTTIGAGAFT
jgi:hypothetical protein